MNDEESAITDKSYWDKIHGHREGYRPLDCNDYRYYLECSIFCLIKKYYQGGSVLEIGAGSSDWLIEICKNLNPRSCVGLDYSESGCNVLREKSEQAEAAIEVVLGDMFSPSSDLLGVYDFVLSFGVVEHFKDLPKVLESIKKFAKPGAIIFTLIPNMSGFNGWLTRRLNRAIYDLHNPHDLNSLVDGHKSAKLEVLWSGYFGSTNFGVLSSCFCRNYGIIFFLYKQLTRISKLIWMFEKNLAPLPAKKFLSPYIIVVSRVSE